MFDRCRVTSLAGTENRHRITDQRRNIPRIQRRKPCDLGSILLHFQISTNSPVPSLYMVYDGGKAHNFRTVRLPSGKIMTSTYYAPQGGQPGQDQLLTDRAVFTNAYAVIPKGTMRDIVTSFLPFWSQTRLWVLSRPLSGFAETFSQYIMEVQHGGGSDNPETDPRAQTVLFVVEGTATLEVNGAIYELTPGGYAYLPAGRKWRLHNQHQQTLRFHWIRKAYEAVSGLDAPDVLILNENDIVPTPMAGTDGKWATTRFVDPSDMRHDMHVTIVTFEPGAVIPFLETHVMEHGLYVLEGKAVYRLNSDWVEVEAGDYMWLRAFCPQACYAGGPGQFRYLLYKDVNRHMAL